MSILDAPNVERAVGPHKVACWQDCQKADAENLIEQQLDLILIFVDPVFLLDPAHLPLLVEIPEDVQTANGGIQRAKEIFLACAVTTTIT